jgi:chromate reductase, NAD(P)H dehydrogenase (quinone)
MADTLNVLAICGSLRKGSYNAVVQRALPSLAPKDMMVVAAPSFAEFPLYNADVQNSSGFPAAVNTLADAIRAAAGVIIVTPEYNFSIPGGLKNAIDWVSRLSNQPFAGKPIALQSASPGPLGGRAFNTICAGRWCFSTLSRLTSPRYSSATAPPSLTKKLAR